MGDREVAKVNLNSKLECVCVGGGGGVLGGLSDFLFV